MATLGMLHRVIGFLRYLTVAILGLVMSSTGHAAPKFERLVVFGDSLSDSGNAGRFSNGPVWVEQLADRLGVSLKPSRAGGFNFAVGGARIGPRDGMNSLRAQADLYLGGPRLSERTLHVVYGGGNDLLAAVGVSYGAASVEAAVASLKSIVVDLVDKGATDVLVPNLPDIGITPEVRAKGKRAVEEAGRLTNLFNSALDRSLASLAAMPGLRLYRLNVAEMAERAQADPAALGFTDISNSCIRLPSCEGHLFWDGVHPTTRAHGRLAEAAFQQAASAR
jgi:phospholipase/lecithinase/hemolysin